MNQYFTTGQVAKLLRVSISTLKRWIAQEELAIDEQRNANGWRLFSTTDVGELRDYKKSLRKGGRRFNETNLVPIIKHDDTAENNGN